MKKGDIVILDKDFNNCFEVEIIEINKIYSKVKMADGPKAEWEVMTNRLSVKIK